MSSRIQEQKMKLTSKFTQITTAIVLATGITAISMQSAEAGPHNGANIVSSIASSVIHGATHNRGYRGRYGVRRHGVRRHGGGHGLFRRHGGGHRFVRRHGGGHSALRRHNRGHYAARRHGGGHRVIRRHGGGHY